MSGLGSGLSVVVQDNGGDDLTVNANGAFAFATQLKSGAAYAATVKTQPVGQTCTVTGGSGTVGSASIAGIAVGCVSNPSSTTITTASGAVKLDASAGTIGTVSIVAAPAGAPTGISTPFGWFSFNISGLASGASITLTYTLPAGFTPTGFEKCINGSCAAPNGVTISGNTLSYTVTDGGTGDEDGTANGTVTDPGAIVVMSVSIGGTISGLGAGLSTVLQNNGGDNLSVNANGPFTFATPVATGGAYAVSVMTQPTGQTCTVNGGSGTAAANVSSVAVSCATIAITETVLHSFGATGDGALPYGSLIQASDGNFYGMTSNGGAHSYGTVIEVTAAGAETVLFSFGTNNNSNAVTGGNPRDSLIQTNDGNFYGMATNSGLNGGGVVFNLTLAGVETVLHTFVISNNSGGDLPGSLIQASNGNFYGMTNQSGANDAGTVFTITPAGVESVLYSFTGGADSGYPSGSLIQASDGNFYGMTNGAANDLGTVFKITPAGVESVLHTFTGGADGAFPLGSLIQASDGNFYGMTNGGDVNTDHGTMFKITPAGVETVLYVFTGGADGGDPAGSLIQASDGNFYGMTVNGGANNLGAVFKVTPGGVETVQYSFGTNPNDGAFPYGSMIQASDGKFYGMTSEGGANNMGTVFSIN